MYYPRTISLQIKKLSKGFPVISVTGPRQSGKTTFLNHHFENYKYFNLENPSTLSIIESDPQSFLDQNSHKIIIDEIQRLPNLLSYIQDHVDRKQKMGSIIISGSQNLLISEKISQSLAGRAAYQMLLPFSLKELKKNKLDKVNWKKQILTGFYPSLYRRRIEAKLFYNQYLSTYVERDARLIRNITNLSQFRKFIGLVAGRTGQLTNVASLANDTGISPNTAEDWLSILEASYIIYRLQPYYKNVGKRLIKSPKIYFYDTGLLCALLNLSSENELSQYYNLGGIFENFIISEIKKQIIHNNTSSSIYFYRDSHGNEVDLIIDTGINLIPIEIKSSSIFSNNFTKGLNYFNHKVIGKENNDSFIVNSGKITQKIGEYKLVGWNNLETIIK